MRRRRAAFALLALAVALAVARGAPVAADVILEPAVPGSDTDDGADGSVPDPMMDGVSSAAPHAAPSLRTRPTRNATSAPFSIELLGDLGSKIPDAFMCCAGLADNIRPTMPLQWRNAPLGTTSVAVVVYDESFTINNISWPQVLSILVDLPVEHPEVRSQWVATGLDLSGLWVRAVKCPSNACVSWLKASHDGVGFARRWITFASIENPASKTTAAVRGTRMLIDEVISYSIAPDASALYTEGMAEPLWKRASLVLRFHVYLTQGTSSPSSDTCTLKVEVNNPSTGGQKQIFSKARLPFPLGSAPPSPCVCVCVCVCLSLSRPAGIPGVRQPLRAYRRGQGAPARPHRVPEPPHQAPLRDGRAEARERPMPPGRA